MFVEVWKIKIKWHDYVGKWLKANEVTCLFLWCCVENLTVLSALDFKFCGAFCTLSCFTEVAILEATVAFLQATLLLLSFTAAYGNDSTACCLLLDVPDAVAPIPVDIFDFFRDDGCSTSMPASLNAFMTAACSSSESFSDCMLRLRSFASTAPAPGVWVLRRGPSFSHRKFIASWTCGRSCCSRLHALEPPHFE